MIAACRFLLFALIGLLVGIALAAAVQIGANVVRYLVQPLWLDGAMNRLLLLMTGIVAALFMGMAFGFFNGQTLKDSGIFAPVALATAAGYLLDPYYLAELGWRTPVLFEALVRALSILLPAVGLGFAFQKARTPPGPYWLFAIAAILAHTLLPRFALIPILGGDLDLAAMTPVHVLVFARGLLFLILAITAAQLINNPARH